MIANIAKFLNPDEMSTLRNLQNSIIKTEFGELHSRKLTRILNMLYNVAYLNYKESSENQDILQNVFTTLDLVNSIMPCLNNIPETKQWTLFYSALFLNFESFSYKNDSITSFLFDSKMIKKFIGHDKLTEQIKEILLQDSSSSDSKAYYNILCNPMNCMYQAAL